MVKKVHPEKRRFACGIVVKQLPPISELLKEYDFDLEKGVLLHKRRVEKEDWDAEWNKNWAGRPAGWPFDGGRYISLRIKGVVYSVHRLLWKLHTGADPRGVIDHINGIRDDNRICNLRDVTPRVNAMNAVNGRWSKELESRAVMAKAHKEARIEAREREMLARLKAKYEPEPSLAAGLTDQEITQVDFVRTYIHPEPRR